MQRMFNLDKWMRLDASSRLEFSNERPRTVRFEVNAPGERALYVSDDTGECRFLALVRGREVIEFSAPGAFSLHADAGVDEGGDETWIYTADGADVSIKLDAPESFTRIVERRRRNPELELIQWQMNRNMERRLAQQADEFAARLERGLQGRAAQPAGAGDGERAAPSPGQTGGSGSSHPQAAAAASGGAGDGTGEGAAE